MFPRTTAVDIEVTQPLFSIFFSPPALPHSVQNFHTVVLASASPVTTSHTPLKANRVGDIYEEIAENPITSSWPQKIRAPA